MGTIAEIFQAKGASHVHTHQARIRATGCSALRSCNNLFTCGSNSASRFRQRPDAQIAVEQLQRRARYACHQRERKFQIIAAAFADMHAERLHRPRCRDGKVGHCSRPVAEQGVACQRFAMFL
jgi:hypothetical protein